MAHAVELAKEGVFLKADLCEGETFDLLQFADDALVVSMTAGSSKLTGLVEHLPAVFRNDV